MAQPLDLTISPAHITLAYQLLHQANLNCLVAAFCSKKYLAAYSTCLVLRYILLSHPSSPIPSTNAIHFTMDVFGDFCLACDGQTNGSDYCSQTCRLAGLDHYGTSEPASPIYCDTKSIARRPAGTPSSGLYLPPAIDFSVYRVPSSNSVSTVKSSRSTTRSQLSGEARTNLKDYVGSFDQTRASRRRVSVQSNESDDKIPSRR